MEPQTRTGTRSLCFTLAGALLTAAPHVTLAQVYRWTDAQGALHFADRPPPDGEADPVRLAPTNTYGGQMGEPGSAQPARLEPPANSKAVVMFSAQWCDYCREARHYFHAVGIPFRERDIEQDPAARRDYERLGGNGLPLVLVGEQRLSGFSEDSFRRLYTQ